MLKNWLKKILIIALELAVIAGALWYLRQKGNVSGLVADLGQQLNSQVADNISEKTKESFPALAAPVERTFNWEFKDMKYSMDVTLYKSIYDYYNLQPKTFSYQDELPADWENDYYGQFLESNPGDNILSQLASDLKALGEKRKLSADQIVDLTLAFVQAIPYDDAKAKDILSETGNVTMRYPYEVLFEQLGVCSDKSLLATALLREMGYGAALFAYEQDNHMAIGIECPKNYSTYGSGYCYAETTSTGNKIGIIPTFDLETNKTVDTSQLASLDSAESQNARLQQLGQVTVYQKTSGKLYSGIIQTQKIAQEIDKLQAAIAAMLPKLQTLKKQIRSAENKLEDMRDELAKYEKKQNIEKYNALAEKYNDFLQGYQKEVKKYNESVALYNQTIARYNTLIRQ